MSSRPVWMQVVDHDGMPVSAGFLPAQVGVIGRQLIMGMSKLDRVSGGTESQRRDDARGRQRGQDHQRWDRSEGRHQPAGQEDKKPASRHGTARIARRTGQGGPWHGRIGAKAGPRGSAPWKTPVRSAARRPAGAARTGPRPSLTAYSCMMRIVKLLSIFQLLAFASAAGSSNSFIRTLATASISSSVNGRPRISTSTSWTGG